jgi:hypothetical protein
MTRGWGAIKRMSDRFTANIPKEGGLISSPNLNQFPEFFERLIWVTIFKIWTPKGYSIDDFRAF